MATVKTTQWKDIILLSLCWALSWLVDAILITSSVLAAKSINVADDISTFSIALEFLGIALASLPATYMMNRVSCFLTCSQSAFWACSFNLVFLQWGRKVAFSIGSAIGVLGGVLGVVSMTFQDVFTFCASAFLCGLSLGKQTLDALVVDKRTVACEWI